MIFDRYFSLFNHTIGVLRSTKEKQKTITVQRKYAQENLRYKRIIVDRNQLFFLPSTFPKWVGLEKAEAV